MGRVEIKLTVDSGEVRTYENYSDFKKDFLFFWSSGNEGYETQRFLDNVVKTLETFNVHGLTMMFRRNGLDMVFKYYRREE